MCRRSFRRGSRSRRSRTPQPLLGRGRPSLLALLLGGLFWFSFAPSRRSAAPTPCALSQTRSSACAFYLSRSDFPTTGEYLAYRRDTYTKVTGRDLQLEAGRPNSLCKTMTDTLDLARTNIASGVKTDNLKPIKERPAKEG